MILNENSFTDHDKERISTHEKLVWESVNCKIGLISYYVQLFLFLDLN